MAVERSRFFTLLVFIYFPCIGGNYTKGLRFLLKTGMEIPLAVPILNEELGKGHAYPFCHVPHKKNMPKHLHISPKSSTFAALLK